MEQYVIFGPMALFCCVFLALIIGFIVLVVVLINKSKNTGWEGEVVDKLVNEKRDDHNRIQQFYTLVVQTKERKMNVGVALETYNKFKKGDKIKKPKGKLYPEKVNG